MILRTTAPALLRRRGASSGPAANDADALRGDATPTVVSPASPSVAAPTVVPPVAVPTAPSPAAVSPGADGAALVADHHRLADQPDADSLPGRASGEVDPPADMPGPREIPAGAPDDPAPSPGVVPPGDSRSLRHGDEFALVYRAGTCIITRVGRLGTRGQWRVVEYPTPAAASTSYAKECSRLFAAGFTDYRG